MNPFETTDDTIEVKKEPAAPLTEQVHSLLNSSEILSLPENQQGAVILDRYIGSLVRHGGVESSNEAVGVKQPHEILEQISLIGIPGAEGYHTVRELTRQNGLRGGVELLAQDPRTADLLAGISQQLAVGYDEQGGAYYAFTTPAQIDGYLHAGGEKNNDRNAAPYTDPTSWMKALSYDIDNVSRGTSEWRSNASIAQDVQSSGRITPEAHKRAQDLYSARMKARSADVDLTLMQRSAEYIRDKGVHTRAELAWRALQLVSGQKYEEEHDRWFNQHLRSKR